MVRFFSIVFVVNTFLCGGTAGFLSEMYRSLLDDYIINSTIIVESRYIFYFFKAAARLNITYSRLFIFLHDPL